MFSNDLEHNRVLREYEERLDLAELERRSIRIVPYQPNRFSRLRARLLVAVANFMISAGTRIREFACGDPCDPLAEPAQS